MPQGETEQGTDLDNLDEEGAQIERLMDREERGLANELIQLAVDYKKAFKRRVRDKQLGPQGLRSALERLRQSFEPRVRDAIQDRAETMRREAREITIEHNEFLRQALDPRSVANESFEDAFQMTIDSLAREVLNRMEGAAESSYTENVLQRDDDGDDQRTGIDRPADSTLEGVASETGSAAVTEGRDDVAADAKYELERTDEGPSTVYAVRTSVLDSNTCDPCYDLHGEQAKVGSNKYNRIAPPAECEGRRRCRCYFRYITPSDAQDGGDSNVTSLPGAADTEGVAHAPDSEWALIYTWGTKRHDDHPDGEYEIDEKWADDLIANFRWLEKKYGDHPPILRQHNEDGIVFGQIADLRQTDRGVEAKLVWNDFAERFVDTGAFDRLSGHHIPSWQDPESGKRLGPVLYEVSVVSREHLRSLPTLSEARDKIAASDHTVAQSYQAIEDATMPTDEEDMTQATDMDPEMSTEMEGDHDDMEQESVEQMDGGGHGFGYRLDQVIDKATTPEGIPGASREDHLEAIATNSGAISADELATRLDEGSIVYPSDDLLEAVATWMDVDPEQIRTGEVKIGESMGGTDDKDDGGGEPEAPAPTPEQSADSGGVEQSATSKELRRMRRKVAEVKLEGLPVSQPQRRKLLGIAEDSLEHFETAADSIRQAANTDTQQTNTDTTDEPDEPIGVEQGATGSGGGESRVRRLCEEAVEQGAESRADICEHVRAQGVTGDITEEVNRVLNTET